MKKIKLRKIRSIAFATMRYLKNGDLKMQGEDLITAFDCAWNERDVDGLLHLLTPDCIHFDAYFADLVPGWNLAEYLKNDMESANVRYTIKNIIECNSEVAAYNYTAQILDTNNLVIGTYDGAQRLCLNAGKIYRMTDLYVAPPELLSIFYGTDNASVDQARYRAASKFGIEKILQCRRKLIQGMRTEYGYIDSDVSLSKFAREIKYSEDLILLILDVAFNRNFDEFVNKCRIDCAREMIRQQVLAGFSSTDLNVDKRIAKRVGFKSHRSFVEAFRRTLDQTPRQWRRTLQEQQFVNSRAA